MKKISIKVNNHNIQVGDIIICKLNGINKKKRGFYVKVEKIVVELEPVRDLFSTANLKILLRYEFKLKTQGGKLVIELNGSTYEIEDYVWRLDNNEQRKIVKLIDKY